MENTTNDGLFGSEEHVKNLIICFPCWLVNLHPEIVFNVHSECKTDFLSPKMGLLIV